MSNQEETLAAQCHDKKGAIELTDRNIHRIMFSNELVFVYVRYALYRPRTPTPFDKMYDEFADIVKKKYPRSKKVAVTKVINDGEKQEILFPLSRFRWYYGVNIYRNGQLQHYLQELSLTLENYLLQELENPIKHFNDNKELENLDKTKHLIVGYFDQEDMSEYDNFRRVAHNLKSRCQFYIRYGYFLNNEPSKTKRPPKQPTIIFRPANTRHYERETFKGCVKKYDDLNLWAEKKCLVRELTLENLDDMKEEYITFLILFYNPHNHNGVKVFHDSVEKTLVHTKTNINCVTADGLKFAKLLQKAGKTEKHLPIVAYNGHILPKFHDISNPEKLKEFINSNYRYIDKKSYWHMVSTVRYAFQPKRKKNESLDC